MSTAELTSEQLDELESLFKYVPGSALIEIDLPARGGLYRLRGDMARGLIAQARRADKAEGLLRRFAAWDSHDEEYNGCMVCEAPGYTAESHKDDCAWMAARTLVAGLGAKS